MYASDSFWQVDIAWEVSIVEQSNIPLNHKSESHKQDCILEPLTCALFGLKIRNLATCGVMVSQQNICQLHFFLQKVACILWVEGGSMLFPQLLFFFLSFFFSSSSDGSCPRNYFLINRCQYAKSQFRSLFINWLEPVLDFRHHHLAFLLFYPHPINQEKWSGHNLCFTELLGLHVRKFHLLILRN